MPGSAPVAHTNGHEPSHVGILGGSFDPPHIGHQLLALSFLALEPIEELWIIPCANHAFKGALSGFHHRFAMCEIAFRRITRVRVLDVENHLNAPNYTLQTLKHLKAQHPSTHFHLGLGSDLVQSFDRWHGAGEVVQNADIVIFERSSYPIASLPTVLAKARVHRGYALPDINSTRLRDFAHQNRGNASLTLVDRDVVDYIAHHGLYRV